MQSGQCSVGLGGGGGAAVSQVSPVVVVVSCHRQFLCCFQFQCELRFFSTVGRGEKKSRDHVIVSSGWWSYQAGRVEGGGSGTRDELGALHSALREQAPPAKGGENPSLQPALCSC